MTELVYVTAVLWAFVWGAMAGPALRGLFPGLSRWLP